MSAWGIAIIVVLLSAAGCNESQSIGAAPRDAVAAASHSRPPAPTISDTEPLGEFAINPHSKPVKGHGPFQYRAYTHCGLDYAFDFDGSLWDVVEEPPEAGTGLEDPYDEGLIEMSDENRLTFTSENRVQFVLMRTDEAKYVYNLCR